MPMYVPLEVSISVMPALDAELSAVLGNPSVNVTGKTSALPLMSRLIDTLVSFDEGELAFCGFYV